MADFLLVKKLNYKLPYKQKPKIYFGEILIYGQNMNCKRIDIFRRPLPWRIDSHRSCIFILKKQRVIAKDKNF